MYPDTDTILTLACHVLQHLTECPDPDLTLASKVLPHPGGPANRMPCDLDRPKSLKASGCLTGAYNVQLSLENFLLYQYFIQ